MPVYIIYTYNVHVCNSHKFLERFIITNAYVPRAHLSVREVCDYSDCCLLYTVKVLAIMHNVYGYVMDTVITFLTMHNYYQHKMSDEKYNIIHQTVLMISCRQK